MIQFLKHLDRRWIFLVILLSAILPLLFPVHLPTVPGKDVQGIYDAIEALPPDSVVLMSFDFGPSTQIEIKPALLANLRHIWRRKDLKIVALGLWPEGAKLGNRVLKQIAAEQEKLGAPRVYGVDYVNLGYKAGGAVALRGVGSGFATIFPEDISHKRLSDLPLMSRVKDYSDVALLLSYSGGVPGIKEHIQVAATQYNVKVGGSVTAVSAPEMSPYLNSGQLVGLMGGLRGAAEYEVLIDTPGDAIVGMNVQSAVHMVMVIFIIISNVVYFADRRTSRS